METTKAEYINDHPRSYLTGALLCTTWPHNAVIIVGSGKISPEVKWSNLYKALQVGTGEYVVGGKRRYASEGSWWAVRKLV